MASSRKKVIVRRFLPGLLWGYLPSSGLAHTGQPPMLDLLDLSGRIQPVPLTDVKYAAYVRDFNTADSVTPERLTRKTFLARPRTEGLWLRLTLRDGDILEGLAPLDLTLADGWSQDLGVHLVPPDIRGNTQRLFVPRLAIESMEVLAVVTTPSRKKPVAIAAEVEEQPDLFSLALPPDARTQ
ncbi:hypothetical protein Terro_1915 [Terriglobus roseus DSM 18391]|uniref:Uncharacterized protein n=1 Tax=Terriglobus roseus (strain DSM 18391 / NRRL B-41598 / KBS 63) TaxID=926566 RepID=I3ZG37_TERRK|nr:hypothetical protein [Terriglobus roseus]AFL88205.1 hypothetical protein Terro_1915 [Terriglobus roseus DSM 18391]